MYIIKYIQNKLNIFVIYYIEIYRKLKKNFNAILITKNKYLKHF